MCFSLIEIWHRLWHVKLNESIAVLSINFRCMTALLLLHYRDFSFHRLQPQPKPAQTFFLHHNKCFYLLPLLLFWLQFFFTLDFRTLCLSWREVSAPPAPHPHSGESTVGQHSEVRRRGRGGAAGLLESTKRILCETETSGLTEMQHSCEATVSPRLFKPAFCILQPFSLCWPSQRLPPAESTCTSSH